MTPKELAQACELAFNSVEQLSKEAKEREKGSKTMSEKQTGPVVSAAPTAETRVRFVVEYREYPSSEYPWTLEEVCTSEEKARESSVIAIADIVSEFPAAQVRIVRETSVITREVLP